MPVAPAAGSDESRGTRPTLAAVGAAGHPRESEILAAMERLPTLPTIVRRILEMVAQDKDSAASLGALVELDLVLTAKLLKLVNSPFYGLSFLVTSVEQAVTMIGFGGVRSLVVAASISELLVQQQMDAYGFTPRGLWKNGIATANMARAIVVAAGGSSEESDDAFIAGLMRDIGMLVLGPLLAQRGLELRRHSTPGDIIVRERELLGFDHCWVGDRLGEKWRLPGPIRLALARHHRFGADFQPAQIKALSGIRLAERLAYASHIGVLADHPFESAIDPLLIKHAGLDASRFQLLMQRLPGVIADADLDV